MRYLVGNLVGVAITVALVAAGAAVDESAAEQVEGPTVCDTYGYAMDNIIEERFPSSRDPVLLARETGGTPLIGYLVNTPRVDMEWDCRGRQLTVVVRGPWTLGAADMETALEVLLDDLRSRELRPVMDGVVVELESALMDDSARFDGVQVERDVIQSLVREAGFRSPVFSTRMTTVMRRLCG
jgi:hypothetical protein